MRPVTFSIDHCSGAGRDNGYGLSVAAVPEPLLLTVEDYRRLPRCEHNVRELHWGAVVEVTRPKMKHARLQSRLVRLLRPKLEHAGVVESEVAFRAIPEYDLRGTDVAFVSQQRWDETPDDDNLHGSPELVIEVLSPSNTQAEMREKSALCLATGTREFWIIDPDKRTVTVATRDRSIIYRQHDSISLAEFGGGEVSLIDIFR